MMVNIRSGLVAGGLAGLLALGAVACQVEDMDPIDDPLEEDDAFEDFEEDEG